MKAGLLVIAVPAALFALPACAPASHDYPIIGGGDDGEGGGGSGSGSATVDAGGATIAGRVCLLDDVRDFTSCDPSGAGNLTVALPGVASATTTSDGSFEIAIPTGSNLVWSVTGTGVVPSTFGFGASALIPAIAQPTYDDLTADNGVLEDDSQGAIIGEIFASSAPAVNATAASSPVGDYPAFYATPADAHVWSGAFTSTLGTFWLAGLTPGTTTLTFMGSDGTIETDSGQAVGSGAVTFVTYGL